MAMTFRIIDHGDARYSLVGETDRIILNRVRIQQVLDWLEDRYNESHPDEPSWDDGVPQLEPIVKPELLTVSGYRVEADDNGLLTVLKLDSDEILAKNISPDQLNRIMIGEDPID